MKKAIRIPLVILVVLSCFYYAVYTPILYPVRQWSTPVAMFISLLCTAASGIFVWMKTGNSASGLFENILLGGILLGSFGFFCGFAGPILLTPNNNLGPMLGILYLGPYSFFAGLISGGLWWWYKKEVQDKKA